MIRADCETIAEYGLNNPWVQNLPGFKPGRDNEFAGSADFESRESHQEQTENQATTTATITNKNSLKAGHQPL